MHTPGTLQVEGETLATILTQPAGALPPSILFLHGAGGGCSARFAYLAEALAAHGYASFRFDHSGQGESTGATENSSLARKLTEARAILPNVQSPLTLIGSSMGGPIATQLTMHAEVKNLILFVPAAYTSTAQNINFGPAFKHIISQPQSWRDSELWSLLQTFTGNLVLITAGHDDIIPEDVIRHYWSNSPHA